MVGRSQPYLSPYKSGAMRTTVHSRPRQQFSSAITFLRKTLQEMACAQKLNPRQGCWTTTRPPSVGAVVAKMHTIPPHVEQATRDWEPDLGGCCNPRPNLPSFLVAGHDRVGNPWREGQREEGPTGSSLLDASTIEHLTMHGFKPIQEWTRSGMLTLVLTCHGRPCRV